MFSSVFAMLYSCNNPGCSNLAGPTELSMVKCKAASAAGSRLGDTVGGSARSHNGSSTCQCARCCRLQLRSMCDTCVLIQLGTAIATAIVTSPAVQVM
jgi:hypothetical protein